MFWIGFLIGYVIAHPVFIITITLLAKYFRKREKRRYEMIQYDPNTYEEGITITKTEGKKK